MANQYAKRLIQFIDRIGGRFESGDPFQKFRRRAFIILLLILALVCMVQAITAWLAGEAILILGMMVVLFLLVLISLVVTRRSPQIEVTAAVVLSFLVLMGALLEVMVGRSPNTPLVFWSPVMIFGAYVFCGIKRGSLVAVCVVLSTLAIIALPFAFDDARVLPGRGVREAYQKRLFVTVTLCHLLPLFILTMYEKFFALCHDEARILLDRIESRKDRAFLGRLAQMIVAEMEPELERMEKAYHQLQKEDDLVHATDEVLQPLHRLVHLTRRYEPLSAGALAAIDKGLVLQDFPEILKRFTDFSTIDVQGAFDSSFRFQGGQAFFLLIFLCMTLRELMENPRTTLQNVTLRAGNDCLEVIIRLLSKDQDLRLAFVRDFLHDLEAKVRFKPAHEGGASSRLEIEVPLARS